MKTPLRDHVYVRTELIESLTRDAINSHVICCLQTEEDTPTPQGPTTATAPVTIRILDVNDQIPTFNQDVYNTTVLENTQAMIPVSFLPADTQMIVTDLDQV